MSMDATDENTTDAGDHSLYDTDPAMTTVNTGLDQPHCDRSANALTTNHYQSNRRL